MLVWLNRVLAGLIFAFTAIAAVNTLAMIGLSRGRELALLRLVGATPRQVARMARWEAGLVVLVGIGLGAAVAAAALVPFSRALTGSSTPDIDFALAGRPGRRHRGARPGGEPAADPAGAAGEPGRRDRDEGVGTLR